MGNVGEWREKIDTVRGLETCGSGSEEVGGEDSGQGGSGAALRGAGAGKGLGGRLPREEEALHDAERVHRVRSRLRRKERETCVRREGRRKWSTGLESLQGKGATGVAKNVT